MDEYAHRPDRSRQHDPDQIVPSDAVPADDARPVPEATEADRRDVEPAAAASAGTGRPVAAPPRQGFWGALTDEEQMALLASAEEVVYPVGTVLWSEGETADQAVVIQSGTIRVSVNRAGRERIIAFRRGGDIIGERAALLLRRRSATIVAMDTVRGLRMTTQRFAVYLSDHPRVVAVLERELYDRLTEPPGIVPPAPAPAYAKHETYAQHETQPAYAEPDGSWSVHALPVAHVPAQERWAAPAISPPSPAGPSWTGRNCTIVFTDIAGFSEPHRNDRDRLDLRRAMYALLREAFEESAVPWDACHVEDRGDGALIVVPPEVPTAAVVDPMIALLGVRLRSHNERSPGAVRFQLRVAVHVGPVMPDPPGVSGWALIRTARLLDARPLRDRLAASGADLGFIASNFVYESVIAHGPGYVDPAQYEPISCRVKKLKTEGWIHLRGVPAKSAV